MRLEVYQSPSGAWLAYVRDGENEFGSGLEKTKEDAKIEALSDTLKLYNELRSFLREHGVDAK